MEKESKIYIAGHNGMVGSSILRILTDSGYKNLIFKDRKDLDLTRQAQVEEFFSKERPDYVFLAAARVGGIKANMNHPAEFIHQNILIQDNIIHQSYVSGVKKFCFLGSCCIYPRECLQPMKEEYLMTGPLEPSNEGYAVAKISGLRMLQCYRKQYGFLGISIMPCNLYGTNDHYDLINSHVLSAFVKRFVDAVDEGTESITLWGSGKAKREFMHVDDAAKAIIFLMENYDSPEIINIGCGEDISIKELANIVASQAGYKGKINWDTSKPDGMPRKCLDVSRMKALGFSPSITLEQGIKKTISEYRSINAK